MAALSRRDLLASLLAAGSVLPWTNGCRSVGGREASDRRHRKGGPAIPVVYCTDLFHPHDDPDDHFDLATIYALPGIDLRGIVLDQGAKQGERPGRIPVSQLNRLSGRHVPCAIGLANPLSSPADTGRDQGPQFQEGVRMLLDVLEASSEPVAIVAVGSVRDVVAAFNRAPDLFRQKVARLLVFIGEASDPGFQEYNVGLDPAAYVGLMRSGLPIDWVPCFDGGLWQNRGHASFWRVSQQELLKGAPPELIQFFIYALERERSDPAEFLSQSVDPVRCARLLAMERNLWCTAILGTVAGLTVLRDGTPVVAATAPEGEMRTAAEAVFGFEEIRITVGDDGVVRPDSGPGSRSVRRFVVRDPEHYVEAMTRATALLLAGFPLRR